jgi:ketosteroid isomerase-like protein
MGGDEARETRNAEVVRAGYEYFNRTGRAPLQVLAADVVLHESDAAPVGGEVFEGHAGVERALSQLAEAFVELRFEVEDLRERGDIVVTLLKLTGRGALSSVPVEIRFGHVLRLRDGLIVDWEVHQTPARALAAAGFEAPAE